ncbi:hypothetical protein TWF481_002069 [Arthrobotrys musiformis]|uniref:Sushi domain-containing protein n=1 Tax=Arthrobotrys musiformis TaxID=47236 RepID=A0AAV9VS83_9PEZI
MAPLGLERDFMSLLPTEMLDEVFQYKQLFIVPTLKAIPGCVSTKHSCSTPGPSQPNTTPSSTSKSNEHITATELSEIVNKLTRLRGIHVHTCNHFAYNFILSQLQSGRPITDLSINLSKGFFYIPDSSSTLSAVRNLRQLSVGFNWGKDDEESLRSAYRTIRKLIALNSETLDSLNIVFASKPRNQAIFYDREFPKNLGSPLRLKELRMRRCIGFPIVEDAIQFFVPEVLTTLSLIETPEFYYLLSRLAINGMLPNLKALQLSYSLTDIAYVDLILSSLPPLENLSLVSGPNDIRGCKLLPHRLENHKPSLKVLWLDIEMNDFDFSGYPNLKELALPCSLEELKSRELGDSSDPLLASGNSKNIIVPSLEVILDGKTSLRSGPCENEKACKAEYFPVEYRPGEMGNISTIYKGTFTVLLAGQLWKSYPESCVLSQYRGTWGWIGKPLPSCKQNGQGIEPGERPRFKIYESLEDLLISRL